jgi:choline dehydrogenase-like flavoprotein
MIRVFAIFLITSVFALAQYQKLDAPINANGRTLSFHIFHFDGSKSKLELHPKPTALEKPLNRQVHLAAVALGAVPSSQAFSLHIKNGVLQITKATHGNAIKIGPQLLRPGSPQPVLDKKNYARRTFLLHDGGKRWAIGYAPQLSQMQLATAIAYISANGPVRYRSAYQLNAGNHSSLWVKNDEYHPFYLKELKQPLAALSIR